MKHEALKKQKGGFIAGFTLVELIVVVFVITIISTLIISNYKEGERRYSLSQAAQRLASDIRRAQNMTISGIDIKGQYCGYGIVFPGSGNYYFLYADDSISCDLSDNRYDDGDYTVETIYFPAGVSFETPPSSSDIFFKPPRPTTFFDGGSSDPFASSFSAVLWVGDATGQKYEISLTKSGGGVGVLKIQ